MYGQRTVRNGEMPEERNVISLRVLLATEHGSVLKGEYQ